MVKHCDLPHSLVLALHGLKKMPYLLTTFSNFCDHDQSLVSEALIILNQHNPNIFFCPHKDQIKKNKK